MMATLRRLPAALFVAALSAACGNPLSPTEQELDDNREKWERQGIDSYALTVRELCFCPIGRGGPFRVTVVNGRVASVEHLGEGTSEPHERFPLTVDDLFATVSDALREADDVEAVYDPVYGFPSDIRVDRIANAIDDEVSYEARDFLPAR